MIIGVDIDGVINDILSICVRILNSNLDGALAVGDITDYDLSKCYNISQEDLQAIFVREEEELLGGVEPQQEASGVLSALIKEHYIVLITARPAAQRAITEHWLKKHGISYNKLVTVGSHDKRPACRREQVEVFIEDRLENALMIRELDIPVLLMDAPHNQGKLPEGVSRVHDWLEIKQMLLRRKNKTDAG